MGIKRKIISSVLAFGMLLSMAFSGSACTGSRPPLTGGEDSGGRDEAYDPNKTQVQVFVYNAGYKDEWLKKLEEEFEEVNKDTVYEAGKKGVQVRHVGDMKQFTADDIKNSDYDIFFFEGGDYYAWKQSGALEDITSIVTEKSKYDGKTVRSKLDDRQISFFGGVTADGVQEKYYGLPNYKGYYGFIYNVEIFDDYGFYIADSDTVQLISKSNSEKSKGPDGKTGTENGIDYSLDDGLPATYEEFLFLCEKMLARGVTPLMLPGQYSDYYLNELYNVLVAEYEGADQMELNLSFKGRATDLVKVTGNGDNYTVVKENGKPVIETVDVDYANNGYEIFRQAGKYYALEFIQKLLSNEKNYNEDGFNMAFSQTDAEEMFLKSGTDMSVSDEKYAMLVDGSWWEAEANVVFNSMAKKDKKYSRQNRKFGWMPLPKANKDKVGEEQLFVDYLESMVCVKSGLKGNKQAALDFVQFACRDEALDQFTQITHALKAFKHTFSNETVEGANSFTKSLINYAEKSKDFSYFNNSPFYLKNRGTLLSTKINTMGDGTGTPITLLKEKKIKSGEEYFLKSYAYWKKKGAAFWKEV